MHGVSWGAYWATKMAIVERARLRGCSAQSPPVDKFFQKDFLMNSLLGNREYLFDQVPALMNILEGVHSLDEMGEYLPKLSLVHQGLLGKPMAPMLDPRGCARYTGSYRGRISSPEQRRRAQRSMGQPARRPSRPASRRLARSQIFKEVIIPWLVKTLQAPAN